MATAINAFVDSEDLAFIRDCVDDMAGSAGALDLSPALASEAKRLACNWAMRGNSNIEAVWYGVMTAVTPHAHRES